MPRFKKISSNIEKITIKTPQGENLYWINIKNPGKQELEYLRKNYPFKMRQLEWTSAKSISHRPIIEDDEEYLFLILQFPVYSKNKIHSEEVNFFMGENYIITLHNNKIRRLNDLFNTCKKDQHEAFSLSLDHPPVILFEMLKRLINHCYSLIDKNNKSIDKIGDIIFNDSQQQVTSQILFLRLNILNIRKIVQNHKNTLKKLIYMENNVIPDDELRKNYKALIEHSKRVWEFSENQKEVVEALYDTNASLLNHRINETMKTLTIFSVSVLPIALVSAIFGTNLTNGMPLINLENGFWIALSIMVAGSLGMLLFFTKKKWL